MLGTGFPGRCARCGGPQVWTVDSGDSVWVCCENVLCMDVQMVMPGFEDVPHFPCDGEVEPEGGTRVVPPEGGAAAERDDHG